MQAGAIPIDTALIERAIELNGVAVQRNVTAFRWGRRWYVRPDEVEQAAGVVSHAEPETLDGLIDRLAADLTDYQSARYADRFRRDRGHGPSGRAARRPGRRSGSPTRSPATCTS